MYCDLDDVKKVLPEAEIIGLTDDNSPPVEVDEDNLNEAVFHAEDVINCHLLGKYTIPLNPVPRLIKNIAVDITVFRLYARRPDVSVPEGVLERYKNAIKLLESINKGFLSIGLVDPQGSENPEILETHGSFRCNKTADDKVFNKDLLDKY